MRVSPNALRAGRVVAAAFVGGLLALGASSAALADTNTGTPKAEGGLVVVNSADGKDFNAAKLNLDIKGDLAGLVQVYCIDLRTPIGSNKVYEEGNWESSGVNNLTKIQWVLSNGYPHVTASALATAAGVSGSIDEQVAVAATQSAIWHFSDGFVFGGVKNGQSNAQVKAIYDYLTTKAADYTQPVPKLTISGDVATAKVGEKAGPFTVASTSGDITLAVKGGKIFDANGAEITKVGTNGQFWVKGDEAGTVTVTATGVGKVPAGRVFKASDSQTLILASEFASKIESKVTVTVTAGGSSSPIPSQAASSGSGVIPPAAAPSASKVSNSLPVTGSNVGLIVVAGGLLLSAGVAVLMTIRRRRVRFTA